jgi:hypothetical protein
MSSVQVSHSKCLVAKCPAHIVSKCTTYNKVSLPKKRSLLLKRFQKKQEAKRRSTCPPVVKGRSPVDALLVNITKSTNTEVAVKWVVANSCYLPPVNTTLSTEEGSITDTTWNHTKNTREAAVAEKRSQQAKG